MKKSYKFLLIICAFISAAFFFLFGTTAIAAAPISQMDNNFLDLERVIVSSASSDGSTIDPSLLNSSKLLPPKAGNDGTIIETGVVVDNVSSLTISTIKGLAKGASVEVTGVVTAPPGVLSAQYFYIEDETGGIQIYCYGKDFPLLSIGAKITVRGILSEAYGEKRIKISSQSDITILAEVSPISPLGVEIPSIGEKFEGKLIQVRGRVSYTSGANFRLQDDEAGSEIKVQINSGTGIKKPKMRKGDMVLVSGILSQYKDDYRILPISAQDVRIINQEENKGELPLAGPETNYLLYAGAIYLLWNTILKTKKKPMRWRAKSP